MSKKRPPSAPGGGRFVIRDRYGRFKRRGDPRKPAPKRDKRGRFLPVKATLTLDKKALLASIVADVPFELEQAYVSGDNLIRNNTEIWHDYIIRFQTGIDFAGAPIEAFRHLGRYYKRSAYFRCRVVKIGASGIEYAEQDKNLSALTEFRKAINHAISTVENIEGTVNLGDYAYLKEVSAHVRAPAWYEAANLPKVPRKVARPRKRKRP